MRSDQTAHETKGVTVKLLSALDLGREIEGLNWEVMDRLYEKGYINNPKEEAKSVRLTDEGIILNEELFIKHFGVSE